MPSECNQNCGENMEVQDLAVTANHYWAGCNKVPIRTSRYMISKLIKIEEGWGKERWEGELNVNQMSDIYRAYIVQCTCEVALSY